MTKHAYLGYIISVHGLRKPGERIILSDLFTTNNLFDANKDLLHLLHGFLIDVQEQHIRIDHDERMLTIGDVAPLGRTIMFTSEYGSFGSSGRIADSRTGHTTHQYGDNESALSTTRNMFVIPEHETFGFYFAERYGGRGAASAVKEQVAFAFRDLFRGENCRIRFDPALDEEAWDAYVRRADLRSVEVVKYQRSSDIAEGISANLIGRIKAEVKPRWGERALPRLIKDKLMDHSLSGQALVAMETDDNDEVILRLDDGTQQKSLIMGNAEPVNLLYPLVADDKDRVADDAVFTAMRQRAELLSSKLHVTLRHGWQTLPWSQKALEEMMAPRRDR